MISVVMGVYNGERYLRGAVESILQQTYTDFEFIIVDDGSTDGTAATLRDIDDERVTVVALPENRGLAAALNAGIALAKGEYIARMDADDISHRERFTRQMAFLEAHPEVGVLGTWVRWVDEAGHAIKTVEGPTTHGAILWHLARRNPIPHPTVIMRRDLAQYDEGFSVAQDYALWAQLADRTCFAVLPEVLHDYRMLPGYVGGVKHTAQVEAMLQAQQQWLTELLGRDVPLETLRAVRSPQPSDAAVAHLLAVFAALAPRFSGDERRVVTHDLVEQVRRLSKARHYWKSRLPTPLWKVVYAILHPLEAAVYLRVKG